MRKDSPRPHGLISSADPPIVRPEAPNLAVHLLRISAPFGDFVRTSVGFGFMGSGRTLIR